MVQKTKERQQSQEKEKLQSLNEFKKFLWHSIKVGTVVPCTGQVQDSWRSEFLPRRVGKEKNVDEE